MGTRRAIRVGLLTGCLGGGLVMASLAFAGGGPPPTDRGYPPPGVTATGSATADVDASGHDTEVVIRRAVRRAQTAATPRAFRVARARAEVIAAAAGIRLGAVWAVGQATDFAYGYQAVTGTFGPDRYCGTIRRRIRGEDGRRRPGPPRRVCRAPGDVTVTLEVTYAQG